MIILDCGSFQNEYNLCVYIQVFFVIVKIEFFNLCHYKLIENTIELNENQTERVMRI